MTKEEAGQLPEEEGSTEETQVSSEEVPKKEGGEEVPKKGEGVAAEPDLKKQLDDAQAQIGKQAQEIGDYRTRLTEYEDYIRRQQASVQPPPQQQAQGMAQPQAQQPEQAVEFDYDNPMKSVQTAIRSEYEKMRKQENDTRARVCFQEGSQIMKNNPDMFKGIENDVAFMMQGGYEMGVFKDPEDLRLPQNWYYAAGLINMKKSGFKSPYPVNPVEPTETQTPAQARPEETEEKSPAFSQADQMMMKAFGKTPEEVVKKMNEYKKKGGA